MADIFSEVDESLRQDRATDLWKKYGPFVIGAAVLLVAAVGAWEYMRYSRAQAIEADARQYSAAMDLLETEDFDGAHAAFSRIAEGEGGFAVIAGHMAGAAAESAGQREAALESFTQAGAKAEGIYSDLAVLKSAYLQVDTITIGELETLLAPLMTGSGAADALSRELIAAKALTDGDIERARRDYQTLSLRLDDGSSLPDFQQRIQRAMLALPPPTQSTPAAPAEEVPTPEDAALASDNQDIPAQ